MSVGEDRFDLVEDLGRSTDGIAVGNGEKIVIGDVGLLAIDRKGMAVFPLAACVIFGSFRRNSSREIIGRGNDNACSFFGGAMVPT